MTFASALGTRSLRPPAWEERFGIFAAPATNVANGFIIAQGYQDDEDDDNANSYDGFWGSWTDDERNRARKVLSPNAKNSWMRIIWKPGPSYRGQGPDARTLLVPRNAFTASSGSAPPFPPLLRHRWARYEASRSATGSLDIYPRIP